MPVMTRRKLKPTLLVFRNFNNHLAVCRLADHIIPWRPSSLGAVAPSLRCLVEPFGCPYPRSTTAS
jgi:hypothetical protein